MSGGRPAILFVDDDTFVLRGLVRVLRAEATEWDLVFVHCAERALLTELHFDIVVSDFQMPFPVTCCSRPQSDSNQMRSA